MCDLVTVGSSAAKDSLRPLCGRLVCQASIYYVLCIKASIGLPAWQCSCKNQWVVLFKLYKTLILVTNKIMKANRVTFDYNLHCSLLALHFKVTCTQGTGLNQKQLYNALQCLSTTVLPLSSLRCSTASVLNYPSAWVLSKPQGSSCTPPWMESFKNVFMPFNLIRFAKFNWNS